jgi:predicted  nucleic acid-binding Zn-ribbon protein
MTNLEAIAIKLKEEKDKELESILKISGSAANVKNDYGVTIIDDTNVVSSLVFKNLSKPKYDDVELIKAVDVSITELKPNIPTPNLDLVPRPLYTEQVNLVEDLRKQVEKLTITVNDLNNQITTLKLQVQTEINNRLSIEQTNDVLANQIDTLTNTIGDFTGQISISLQKSVDESILRASLQSQNTGFQAQIKALIKQIDSLNSIIEGLQAQLGAIQQQQAIQQSSSNTALASGAEVINKVVLLKFDGPQEDKEFKLRGNGKAGDDNATRWAQGGVMKFTNNDKSEVSINITHKKPAAFGNNNDWIIFPETSFKIPPAGTKDLTLEINGKVGAIDSKGSYTLGVRTGWSHSASYESVMKVTVTSADGSTETKEYKTKYGKMHPDSF